MAEGHQRGKPREPLHRTLFVPIDDLDLNSPDGQNEMLKRMQTLLATQNHNALDLNAFKILKDSIKVKTDLNVWMAFNRMQKMFDEWKARQKTENP